MSETATSEPSEPSAPVNPVDPLVIRLPRTAYLAALVVLVGAVPLAFGTDSSQDLRSTVTSGASSGASYGWRMLVLLIPVIIAVAIARTATVVSTDGVRVRALLGSRSLAWDAIRGLSVRGRAVYAVLADGSVRLPCVRIAHLGPISRVSAGRIPELPDARPKPAAQRRRR